MGIKALGIFSSTVNSKIGKWKKPEITPPRSDHSAKLITRHQEITKSPAVTLTELQKSFLQMEEPARKTTMS